MDIARECAGLTIPSLLPPEGADESTELAVPYSSAPARFVSGCASKLTTQVVPLNDIPMFGLEPEGQPDTVEQGIATMEGLRDGERAIMGQLKTTNLRQAITMVWEHLAVVGDVLLCQRDDFVFQLYRLDHYVVQRDWAGVPYRIIFREFYPKDNLPSFLQGKGGGVSGTHDVAMPMDKKAEFEVLYTELTREATSNKWQSVSEFRGQLVNPGTYAVSAYWPLRWNGLVGEDYGRSLCEENIGDLRQLDALSKAMVEGAAASSFFFYVVDPTGYTELVDVQNVLNGGMIPGRKADIEIVQADNVQQLQATAAAIGVLIRQLGSVFLSEAAVQPTGERVTAYQSAKFSADQMESVGAALTNFYHELQPKIVARTMALMEAKGTLPEGFTALITDGKMKINIKTGLETLSRELDKSKLSMLIDRLEAMPESAQNAIDWTGFLAELFAASGVDPRGKIKTREQQAQEASAAQRSELQQHAATTAIDALGKGAQEAMAQA